jgi:hypothetical protein
LTGTKDSGTVSSAAKRKNREKKRPAGAREPQNDSFCTFLSPGRRAWPLHFREGFWPGFQAEWSEKTGV